MMLICRASASYFRNVGTRNRSTTCTGLSEWKGEGEGGKEKVGEREKERGGGGGGVATERESKSVTLISIIIYWQVCI